MHGARVWFDGPKDDCCLHGVLHIAAMHLPPSPCPVHALQWMDSTSMEITIDADGLDPELQCHVTLLEALTGEGVTAPRVECAAHVLSCNKNGVQLRCTVPPSVVDVTVGHRNWITSSNHHLRSTMRSALLPRLQLAAGATAKISLSTDNMVRYNSAVSDLQILCGVLPDACVQMDKHGLDAQTILPTSFVQWLDAQ